MASTSTLLRIAAMLLLLAITCSKMADACSCMLTHPQEHACNSDFVIVATVKRFIVKDAVYKVRVRRELKTSEKATQALKSGRLMSSKSSCGVDLKPEVTYLIAGRVVAGQARINLCSYIKPWAEVTSRQRKGFKLLYKLGCSCKIVDCPWYRSCPDASRTTCNWVTSRNSDVTLPDCQSANSVCTRLANGGCGWIQDRQYRECMKSRRRIRDEQLAREP